MYRCAFLAVAILCLALAPRLHAQAPSELIWLPLGREVRVTVAASGPALYARFDSLRSDTVFLSRRGVVSTVALRRVRELDVRLGTRVSRRAMVIGGIVGCNVGGAVGFGAGLIASAVSALSGEQDPERHILRGGAVGAISGIAVGVLAGSAVRETRWMRVNVPH